MLPLGTHADDGWFCPALAADLLVGRSASRLGHDGIRRWRHHGGAERDRRIFDIQTFEGESTPWLLPAGTPSLVCSPWVG